jgi:hypothetical protein
MEIDAVLPQLERVAEDWANGFWAGAGAASLVGVSLRLHAAMTSAARAAVVARANDLPCITRLPGSGERHY